MNLQNLYFSKKALKENFSFEQKILRKIWNDINAYIFDFYDLDLEAIKYVLSELGEDKKKRMDIIEKFKEKRK